MSTTSTRKGGCGCGGQMHTHNGNGDGGCGCKPAQPCGCQDHGPRVVLGDCNCEGPVRCGVPCLERPAYSAGQLLTADSLRLGQKYFEDKFALRRYVDGVGVVCGLHVRCDPDEHGWVIVDPGYAIDCCGNDIVLCEPVRFNVCKAIAACPTPEEPCEDVVVEAPPRPVPQAPAAEPVMPDIRKLAAEFLASRGTTQAEQDGALLSLATRLTTAYWQWVDASTEEYATGLLERTFQQLQAFWAQSGIPLADSNTWIAYLRRLMPTHERPSKPPEPAPVAEPPGEFHTYVLRIERTWEGRAPTAVVVSRAGCDPRPESRPSKEAGSVRLCVSKLDEASTSTRVRDRTQEFRQAGKQLLQRIARAIEVANGLPADQEKDPNPQGRLIAEALLAMLREEPARSSCNLYDLICDVRRLITKGTPQCFGFPQSVIDNPELALAGAAGQLIDDFRELYLTRGCDDCCEQIGVRVGHVITQELLPACAPRGCSIAAIDTHAPARETLHPRSGWYHPDQVAVYDAYFLGIGEAGVLLSARGLAVEQREANANTAEPTGFETVWSWIKEAAPGELGRFQLYQMSVLYADFGSNVTLWTVGGRVVAITVEGSHNKILAKSTGTSSRIAYLKHSLAPLAIAERAVVIDAANRDVILNREAVTGGAAVRARETRAPAAAPKPETTPAESTAILSKLDPAPFRDIIWGVGAKTETAFYLRGIDTLQDLIDTPDMELAEMLRIGEIEYVKAQASDILNGKISFSADELLQWGAAARLRKAKIERSIA